MCLDYDSLRFPETSILKWYGYSLCLDPKGIKYQHSYGHWQINWQQIERISLINETIGLTQIQLPYIGIRLTHLTDLAKQISPRLANRLIHEQKPLLALAIKLNLLSMEQSQLNFSPYLLASGEILKGPLAAFLHHSSALHLAFGYHVFLPETAIDRDLDKFCQLLQQCKKSSVTYS